MKLPHAFLAAGLLLLHNTVSASTNIPVRMFCLSVAVDRSTTFQNGEEFDLEVTSLDSTQPANGEMAALSEEPVPRCLQCRTCHPDHYVRSHRSFRCRYPILHHHFFRKE